MAVNILQGVVSIPLSGAAQDSVRPAGATPHRVGSCCAWVGTQQPLQQAHGETLQQVKGGCAARRAPDACVKGRGRPLPPEAPHRGDPRLSLAQPTAPDTSCGHWQGKRGRWGDGRAGWQCCAQHSRAGQRRGPCSAGAPARQRCGCCWVHQPQSRAAHRAQHQHADGRLEDPLPQRQPRVQQCLQRGQGRAEHLASVGNPFRLTQANGQHTEVVTVSGPAGRRRQAWWTARTVELRAERAARPAPSQPRAKRMKKKSAMRSCTGDGCAPSMKQEVKQPGPLLTSMPPSAAMPCKRGGNPHTDTPCPPRP